MAKPITVDKVPTGRSVDFIAYEMSRLLIQQGKDPGTFAQGMKFTAAILQNVSEELVSRYIPAVQLKQGPTLIRTYDVKPKDGTLTRLIINQAAFIAGCVVLSQKVTAKKITVNFYNDIHVASATVSGLRGKDFLDGYLDETDYRKILNVIANAVNIQKYGDITNATTAVVTIGTDETEYVIEDVNQIYSPVSCYLMKDKVYALDLMKSLENFLTAKQLVLINTKGELTKKVVPIVAANPQIIEVAPSEDVTAAIGNYTDKLFDEEDTKEVQEVAQGSVSYIKVATDEGVVLIKLAEFPILVYLESIACYYRLLYGSEDKQNPIGHILGSALAGSVKMIRGKLKTIGFDVIFNSDTGEFMYTASTISSRLRDLKIPEEHINYSVSVDKVYNFCDAFVLGLRMPNENLVLGEPLQNDFFKLRPNTINLNDENLTLRQRLSIVGNRVKDDLIKTWSNPLNIVGPIGFINNMKALGSEINDHFFNNINYNSVYDSLFLIWRYAAVAFSPGSVALSFVSLGNEEELYYKVLAILYYHMALEVKTPGVTAELIPIVSKDFTTVDLYEATEEVTDTGFIMLDDGSVHPYCNGETDTIIEGDVIVNYLKKTGSLPARLVLKGKTFFIPLVIPSNEVAVAGEKAEALGAQYVQEHRSVTEKVAKEFDKTLNFIGTNAMKVFNLTDTSDYNKALDYLGNQGLQKANDGVSALLGIPLGTDGGSARPVGAVVTKMVM